MFERHLKYYFLSLSLLFKIVRINIYKTVLSVALYGCEPWPVTTREMTQIERVDRVLRRDAATGG
jgi:hypothetical protein